LTCIEAPHHVTALFRPVPGPAPGYTGSIGFGVALETRYRLCRGLPPEGLHPSEPPQRVEVMKRLGADPSSYWGLPPLPPGRGYAVSAAAAVAGALAASLERGIGLLRALGEAHAVEVERVTGLGDVAAIACGVGAVYRLTPSPPGAAHVECIPLKDYIVVTGHGGAVHTKRLLEAYSRLTNLASPRLERALRRLDPERDLEEAQAFTVEARLDRGLLGGRSLAELLPRGKYHSFYVKKSVAVVITWPEHAGEIAGALQRAGLEARIHEPSTSPPRIART